MRKQLIWAVIGLLLALTLSFGVAQAQTSTHYDLGWNAIMGAYSGGTVMKSTNFRLVTSMGGIGDTSSSSSSFQLCTGYICNSGNPVYRIHFPGLRDD